MKNFTFYVFESDCDIGISGGLVLIVPTVNIIFLLRVSAAYGNKRQCEVASMRFLLRLADMLSVNILLIISLLGKCDCLSYYF